MRVLGFSKKWEKLLRLEFTTFRYPRCDKDWFVGEEVQIVIRPRQKGGGEKLGFAEIIGKERRELDSDFPMVAPLVTESEAVEDGFDDFASMVSFMERQYGLDYISLFNKLTLKWVTK